MSDNPLQILGKLRTLLEEEGYDKERPAMQTIASLHSALRERGYEDVPPAPAPKSYTQVRAQSLHKLSVKLRGALLEHTKDGTSYSDRAAALATISDSYLQLAHAFKVDSKVWSYAQNDLVPVLSAAVDENTVDEAVSRLLSHFDRYISSLEKWLKK